MNGNKDYHGGPAFPVNEQSGHSATIHHQGMSLRDWFAGQALAAAAKGPDQYDTKALAEYVYRIADAMLEAR